MQHWSWSHCDRSQRNPGLHNAHLRESHLQLSLTKAENDNCKQVDSQSAKIWAHLDGKIGSYSLDSISHVNATVNRDNFHVALCHAL